jgi:hypothetical protein
MCSFKVNHYLVVTLCMLSPLLCAAQQAGVNFISFQVPDAEQTLPMSVNDSLTVTGSYINQGEMTEGFFRNVEGDITTFTVPGSTLTSPVAINAAGEIAGNSLEGADFYGFVRYTNGSIARFNPGGKYPGFTYVAGINKEGTIVGSYAPSNGIPPEHGFIRSVNGTITTFDVPGSDRTQPVAINAAGEVAGIYYFDSNHLQGGFVRSADGNITTYSGTPVGINAGGSIVGWSIPAGSSGEGFVRFPQGAINSFGFQPGHIVFPYMGINEAGSIFANSSFGGFLLRSPNGTSTSFRVVGTSITTATSINDSDVITGNYSLFSFVAPGNYQLQCICGFLWMPQTDQR